MLDHDQLVACCDQLVSVATLIRLKPSLRGLRRQAEEARGIHGIKRVRVALGDARERVESPKETEMRLLLKSSGFGELDLNHEVRAPAPGVGSRLDIYSPHLRVAIGYIDFWHR